MAPKMGMRQIIFNFAKRSAAFFAPSQDYTALFGAQAKSSAGATVTEKTAMNVSAVYACVRLISETIAAMPCILFQQTSDSRTLAKKHPLYRLLRYMPNDETNSFDFFAFFITSLLLWGNGYAQIVRRTDGRPYCIRQMLPDRTTVLRNLETKKIIYRTLDLCGTIVELPAEDVLHIHGPGFDGLTGKSVISMARETIGLALATEEFGSKFFGEGANASGILEHPGELSPDAYERLKKDFQERHAGLENANKTMILEEGMTYNTIGVPPEQAQFLGTRGFQMAEIARWFGVPLPLLQLTEKSTSWGSGISQLIEGFIKFTLNPIMTKVETSFLTKLLFPDEWDDYLIAYKNDELLKSEIDKRFDVYAKGRQWGIYSVNDCRKQEGMDPIEGGDEYLSPLNMQDIADPNANPDKNKKNNADNNADNSDEEDEEADDNAGKKSTAKKDKGAKK